MKYLVLIAALAAANVTLAGNLYDEKATPDDITGGTGCTGDFTLADEFVLEPADGGTVEAIDWWITGEDCGTASSAWSITLLSDTTGPDFNIPGDTLWQKSLYPTVTLIASFHPETGFTGNSLRIYSLHSSKSTCLIS